MSTTSLPGLQTWTGTPGPGGLPGTHWRGHPVSNIGQQAESMAKIQVKIDALYRELAGLETAKRAVGYVRMAEVEQLVGIPVEMSTGFLWDCPDSPILYCLYPKTGSSEVCVICGDPKTRQ